MKKIAIAGKSKSGKNTVASLIEESMMSTHQIRIFSFADPIKEICKIMFPTVTGEQLWGPSQLRERKIPTAQYHGGDLSVRQVLLDVGKLGRSYNQDCWARATIGKIHAWDEGDDRKIAIIADLRFKNEMEALKREGYRLIRVYRPQIISTSRDISEVDLDDVADDEFDAVVWNDGGLEELTKRVERLCGDFLKGEG